jgi:hypothetical protein
MDRRDFIKRVAASTAALHAVTAYSGVTVSVASTSG